MKVVTLNNRLSTQTKQPLIERRYHAGLSQIDRRSQYLASKLQRLAHFLSGANADGDLKPMLIFHSENPIALKYFAKSTLPVLCKCNNKSWMAIHLSTTWFTEYLNPTVVTYCSEKRFLSKYYCSFPKVLATKSLDGDVQLD